MTNDREQPVGGRPVGAAERSLTELLTELAAGGISPGAGAAGAITLALAAACAGKAVAISLKHHPQDEALGRARDQLAELRRLALVGADEDGRRFEDFVHSKDTAAADRLLQAGQGLRQLAAALTDLLDVVEARIDAVVAGDLVAARALCAASITIEAENLDENRRANSLTQPGR